MKRSVTILAVLLAASGTAMANDGSDARMEATVRTLTAPELAGRGSGSPGAWAVADSLAGWLASAGWQPGCAGDWFQGYDLRGEGWAGQDLTGLPGRNVAGILPGCGALAQRWLVLGAHYDHLGRVEPADTEAPPPAPDAYYPGANDNASGVAVVLEVARQLAAGAAGEDARSVMVVFFGDEETGLQGSTAFVAAPPLDLDVVDVMVNLDTVGRLHDGALYVSGVGTSPRLRELATAAAGSLHLELAAGGWSGSDHMSFNTHEVPVLFLFGGPYTDYNRPTDTWESLVPADLQTVRGFATRLVAILRTDPGEFPWTMVGDGPLADAGSTGAGNRDTWFGSLPDFAEGITGYKLAGVFDDSPAAQAGLQKGDVLVRLGGTGVTDLATFTRALRSHDPGSLVEVEVRRDGALLRFTVVLGNRADRR